VGVFVVVLLGVSSIEGCLNGGTPLVEDHLEVVDHILVGSLVGVNVLGFVLPVRVEGSEIDVVRQRLQSLSQLTREAVEDRGELSLLLIVTLAPLDAGESLHDGFVNLVNNGVERCDRVLRHLTKKDLVVVGSTGVHSLAWSNSSDEVDTLALELDLLSV